MVSSCPLCKDTRIEVVNQLTGQQLRDLWKALGHEFSADAWGKIAPAFVVAMHRCQSCGFVFFDPSLAGNEAFYRQLEHSTYFCPTRPEFDRTIQFAKQCSLARVLDVGCGSGSFLDLAAKAGMETCGLELNGAAAEKARAKGHKIFDRLLTELDSATTEGGFDLITLFQVLEHVQDPVEVMKQAARFLNPNGCISIAVPSEEGIGRINPWNPHEWPPHHISRWRLADLEQLERATGLKLVEKGGDVLLGSEIEQVWKQHNRLAPVVGKKGRTGRDLLPQMISLGYRKTGMKFMFPHWGHSIYGNFTKL